MASKMNDLSSLKLALNSLKDVLKQDYNDYIRDAAIQRFEYTFELAWKAMKRTLKEEGSEIGSPKQVFRSAFEAKLIDNLEQWFALLKERNLTVHTYNEETAKEVYESAKSFPKVVDQLIYNLENR